MRTRLETPCVSGDRDSGLGRVTADDLVPGDNLPAISGAVAKGSFGLYHFQVVVTPGDVESGANSASDVRVPPNGSVQISKWDVNVRLDDEIPKSELPNESIHHLENVSFSSLQFE